MAESQFVHTTNGAAVYSEDFNLFAEEAALADDRVLAEMFRLAPYDGTNIAKAIVPYRVSNADRSVTQALVRAGTGGVTVNPFRAIVGSRSLAAAGGLDNWRDIRSAIQVEAITLTKSIPLATCAAGVYRWDLIYAAVAVDADAAAVSRKVKDPTTGQVTTQSIVTQKATSVTVAAVTGTAGAAPALPALPADAAGTYNIPLAYVRVPASFGGTTSLTTEDIWEIAPIVSLSEATGGASVRTANGNHATTGAVATRSPWTSTTRPPAFMPATMSGAEDLLVAVDLTTGSVSHNSGDIVDDSRDWSGRVWHVTAVGHSATDSPVFAWEDSASTYKVPGAATTTPAMSVHTTIGQTVNGVGGSQAFVASVRPAELPALAVGSAVALYVDVGGGDTELRIAYSGAPNCKLFFWLRASAPFSNA